MQQVRYTISIVLRMKKYTVISLGFLFLQLHSFAQLGNNPPKTSFTVEGQVAVTTSGEGVYLNFGGPCMKYSFKKIAFSIGMLPSLRFEQDKPRHFVTPILGAGLQVYFLKDRRFIASFPCYYISTKTTWKVTAGLGYLLTRPKK
jgi:hypothetical protein